MKSYKLLDIQSANLARSSSVYNGERVNSNKEASFVLIDRFVEFKNNHFDMSRESLLMLRLKSVCKRVRQKYRSSSEQTAPESADE